MPYVIFCGQDCDRVATLLSIIQFQDFARYRSDSKPYGSVEKSKNFVICQECYKKHNLPNPYTTYSGITNQKATYEKNLDNYKEENLKEDLRHDKQFER